MVQHVYEKAAAVAAHVYVATDDERIYDAVLAFGGRAVMTSDTHRSGTDRCYEAYTKVKELLQRNFDVVVNVQGDEPFIIPEQIESCVLKSLPCRLPRWPSLSRKMMRFLTRIK